MVQAAGGDCLLTIKANQKTLLATAQRLLPEALPPTHLEIETNRSGTERRAITVRTVTAEPLGFPHAVQLAKLQRSVVHRHGRRTQEVVWLVTSLSPPQASPEQLLALIRAYWGIENGIHQRLDVSADEDRCRVRDPLAGWALAWRRRIILGEFYAWARPKKKPRDATLPMFFIHHHQHRQAVVNLLTAQP